jgi:TPR repeat protein
MEESFAALLAVGGKSNSLGRAAEVTAIVLQDRVLLAELYACMFEDDPWVRMRAADCLEKICRVHPDWIEPYIDKIADELAVSGQPSIQWHIAQIYREVKLSPAQKRFAINWLKELLSTTQVDWIVAANAMDSLAQFVRDGSMPHADLAALLEIQLGHHSKSVVRRAHKLLEQLSS